MSSRRFESSRAGRRRPIRREMENLNLSASRADRFAVRSGVHPAPDRHENMVRAVNAGSLAEQLNARCISAVRRPRRAEACIVCAATAGIQSRTDWVDFKFGCTAQRATRNWRMLPIKAAKLAEGTTPSRPLRSLPALAASRLLFSRQCARVIEISPRNGGMRSKCATSVRNRPISTSGFSPGLQPSEQFQNQRIAVDDGGV